MAISSYFRHFSLFVLIVSTVHSTSAVPFGLTPVVGFLTSLFNAATWVTPDQMERQQDRMKALVDERIKGHRVAIDDELEMTTFFVKSKIAALNVLLKEAEASIEGSLQNLSEFGAIDTDYSVREAYGQIARSRARIARLSSQLVRGPYE